jgi:hypothetical protein
MKIKRNKKNIIVIEILGGYLKENVSFLLRSFSHPLSLFKITMRRMRKECITLLLPKYGNILKEIKKIIESE